MTRKLIQIVPATGVHAVYDSDDDEGGGQHMSRIQLWGLYDDGSVAALDAGVDGGVSAAEDMDNFDRLEFDP